MQVKIKKDTQTFQPVTLEVTFETAEELQVISDMLGWDASIPPIVYPGDIRSQRVLSSTMKTLFDVVSSYQRGD